MELRLGTQGWSYADWVGTMYDAATPQTAWLREYAREFTTVEIDSTFYGTPDSRRIAKWRAAVPDGFRFALKVPREITHERVLRGVERPLAEFLEAARGLGDRLGPILVQFPEAFAPDERAALDAFLPLLPARDLEIALEVRNRAWFDDDRLVDALRAHGIALALADTPFVSRERVLELLAAPTAPFLYLRWIGSHDVVARFDRSVIERKREIDGWVGAVLGVLPTITRVYGYVNNHYSGHAPDVVRALYAALGVPHERPARITQGTLF